MRVRVRVDVRVRVRIRVRVKVRVVRVRVRVRNSSMKRSTKRARQHTSSTHQVQPTTFDYNHHQAHIAPKWMGGKRASRGKRVS